MDVKYIDCSKYDSLAQIKQLLKAHGFEDNLPYLGGNTYYIFVRGNRTVTYYCTKDAVDCFGGAYYTDLSEAIKWFEECYEGEHQDIYEELILQDIVVPLGAL